MGRRLWTYQEMIDAEYKDVVGKNPSRKKKAKPQGAALVKRHAKRGRRCVYCGRPTTVGLACVSHNYLVKVDPYYTAALEQAAAAIRAEPLTDDALLVAAGLPTFTDEMAAA